MLSWILQNIGTIAVGAALAAVVVLITVRMIKKRKNGGSSCGCGCLGCAMKGSCHKK